MSTSIKISVTDLVTPDIQARFEALRGGRKELMRRLGKGVEVTLREHFKNRNLGSSAESKRAARGMPQAGIWNQIRQSTSFVSASDEVAVVAISEPAFRAKLFGLRGMTTVRAKSLAIPLDPRVYGKSPRGRPVPGMFQITIKRTGKTYLAIRDGGQLRVMYRLMDSVSVQPDARALPPPETVNTAIANIITRNLSK